MLVKVTDAASNVPIDTAPEPETVMVGATTAFRSVVTAPVPVIATVVAPAAVIAPVVTAPVALIVRVLSVVLPPVAGLIVPIVRPVVALIVSEVAVSALTKLPVTFAAPVELIVVEVRFAPVSVTACAPSVPPEKLIVAAVTVEPVA